jgi:hypothetical protein
VTTRSDIEEIGVVGSGVQQWVVGGNAAGGGAVEPRAADERWT